MEKLILFTRGIVVFPGTKTQFDIGRLKSVSTILVANSKKEKEIVIVSQIDPLIDEPTFKDIYTIGTLCKINSLKTLDDGSLSVDIEGIERVKVNNIISIDDDDDDEEDILYAEIEILTSIEEDNKEKKNENLNLFLDSIKEIMKDMSEHDIKIIKQVFSLTDISKIVDIAASVLPLGLTNRQLILEELKPSVRLEKILTFVISTDFKRKIDNEIAKQVNDTLSKQQKEYYLKEKLKVVKEEIGKINAKESEFMKYRKRVEENPYPENIKERILTEVSKMETQSSPQENSISKAYVELMLELPYWQLSEDITDFNKAEEILNKNHYGLEKVKERIVEYLAVKIRNPLSKSPIICLVGPPGVGKSSLARSIADALGKKFAKMALGGVHDESEIRGHRKTYVGSMAGRILKQMKRVGVINPLFLLDEIDKMSSKSNNGDPASALLEVLDHEQNDKFEDNYLEEPYDLSRVLFVATANYTDKIPEPLYDRLEIIEISSYTEQEKLAIAKKYLIEKMLKEAVISTDELTFNDDAILDIIRHYTREAGVRELSRLIQKISRKFAIKLLKKETSKEVIDIDAVRKYLGKIIFDYNEKDKEVLPGVVNGMAYTSAGGDLLPIEVTIFEGKGNIVLTGNLKDTMKESAQVALGYVKTNAEKFGIVDVDFSKKDIHVHVPSGGVPKDGPSAGVTLTTAIISAITKRKVPNNIAMTGEITLRGKVGIIGGVKEKVISAYRGGINEIFLPKQDERYLEDVPKEIADKINFHLVDEYQEIYKSIFTV
ncbi:MAG: endopeptidase La [Mycoplasmataceae bacterium]|jgi:ATP-dependent Lon protease|nr:endopeptidase La [Mycoplasmataceae bacterium]